MKMKVNMNMGMGVNVKPMIEKDGQIIKEYPLMHNLILNSGMTALGIKTIPVCFEYASVGIGTTPTQRDSGDESPVVTVSKIGTAITATGAGIFASADNGRVIKFKDSGVVAVLSNYSDANNIDCDVSGNLSDQECIIYNVEQLALASKVQSSDTYRVLNNNCGYDTLDADETDPSWINWRTFEFPVETAQVIYTEAGWSWGATENLVGRILFSEQGSDVTVEIGERLLLYVEFVVTYDQTVYDTDDLTPTGLPITGFNQDAQYRYWIYRLGSGSGPYESYLDRVNSVTGASMAGNYTSNIFAVPFSTGENTTYFLQCWLTDDDSAITSWIYRLFDGIAGCKVACSQTGSGSYYKDYEAYFAGTAAASLTGYWNDIRIGDESARPGLRILFDNTDTYTKTTSNTLTLNFRKSWSRIL